MALPFALGNATLFVAFVYLVCLRWEVESLRAAAARRAADPVAVAREELSL